MLRGLVTQPELRAINIQPRHPRTAGIRDTKHLARPKGRLVELDGARAVFEPTAWARLNKVRASRPRGAAQNQPCPQPQGGCSKSDKNPPRVSCQLGAFLDDAQQMRHGQKSEYRTSSHYIRLHGGHLQV